MGDLIRLDAPPLEADVGLTRPVREALVSWNTGARSGAIELASTFADGARSPWLAYVRWNERERRSFGSSGAGLELAVDVARAKAPFTALHVRSDVALDALWVAACHRAPLEAPAASGEPFDLNVPVRSQYPPEHPAERGWCSPAALAMLLAFWGRPLTVAQVAADVYDAAYGGAGNWAFNVAFAGTLGFAATVAYLRDLVQAKRFVAAGIPLAVSIAWRDGELPDPPLPASAGHLVVIRGFEGDGAVLVNDPAQPGVRTVYPAVEFQRAWLGHGGVAYLIAPRARADELLALANR